MAQQRPPQMRVHTATQAQPLTLVAATQDAGTNQVQISAAGSVRTVVSNAIPNHAVGSFPNPGNPNRISAQSLVLTVPANPQAASAPTYGEGWVFGVSTNGVPFDPFAAEYWQGDRKSGWNYAALGGADPVLVVTSGGAIGQTVAEVMGAPADAMIRLQLQIRNCSVTRLIATPRATHLSTFNETPHILGAATDHLLTYS